jgi:hypothetical protein
MNYKTPFYIFLTLAFFVSCNNNEPSKELKPERIIENKNAEDVLAETDETEFILEEKEDLRIPTTEKDISKRYDATNFSEYAPIVKEKKFIIDKSQTIKNGDFTFVISFQKEGKLEGETEINMFSGLITSMEVSHKGKKMHTLTNLKDECYNGDLHLWLGDYNLDGFMDIKMLKACGKGWWYKYYLYNKNSNKYEQKEDWDWLKIDKINPIKKQILSVPSGNCCDVDWSLYQIKGNDLIELEKYYNEYEEYYYEVLN